MTSSSWRTFEIDRRVDHALEDLINFQKESEIISSSSLKWYITMKENCSTVVLFDTICQIIQRVKIWQLVSSKKKNGIDSHGSKKDMKLSFK